MRNTFSLTFVLLFHCSSVRVAGSNFNDTRQELSSDSLMVDLENDSTGNETSSISLNGGIGQDDEVDTVICSLCANAQHRPKDLTARFQRGAGKSITCGEAHELGQMELPRENCTYLQQWGETLCNCGPVLHDQSAQLRCRLCEDGSSLPNGFMAGWPQTTCAEVQVQASRDEPKLCKTYQATVGTYCGCDNKKAAYGMCRICGNQELPDHLKVIDRHRSKTCGELEFDANLPDGDCVLSQKLYADQCCGDENAPIPPIRSSACKETCVSSMAALGVLVVALLGAILDI